MTGSLLFLTLRTFSATGGIEKVCKVLSKGLCDLQKEATLQNVKIYSMYDRQDELDKKYIKDDCFKGFAERKIKFVLEAINLGRKTNVVVLSHINLLLIGLLIKICSPKTKLILIAHGIEVWNPVSMVRRWGFKKCNLILTVSSFTRNRMMELFNIPFNKIIVLNNCLDPFLQQPSTRQKDELLLRKTGFLPSDFVLLTLTRLSSKERYKGYDNVLLSIKTLKQSYPGIKYLIVGKFDEEEIKRVGKIIDELDIKQNVFLSGFVPDEELAKYFQLADVYVMPSKKEGFGIVFIEAMFYGLPVIAGNKDGSTDALLDGKMGLLVDPDNQQEIDSAIEKILLNQPAFIPDNELLLQHFDFLNYKKKVKNILYSLA